jgi:hypothetical protein
MQVKIIILKILIASLIIFYSGVIQASEYLEMRTDFWCGKQFRVGAKCAWENIGMFGEKLKDALDKAPTNIQEKYNPVLFWRPVYIFSSGVTGFIAGWNIVNPTFDWNIAWVGLGATLVSYLFCENAVNDSVAAYNEWAETKTSILLNYDRDQIKLGLNYAY